MRFNVRIHSVPPVVELHLQNPILLATNQDLIFHIGKYKFFLHSQHL